MIYEGKHRAPALEMFSPDDRDTHARGVNKELRARDFQELGFAKLGDSLRRGGEMAQLVKHGGGSALIDAAIAETLSALDKDLEEL